MLTADYSNKFATWNRFDYPWQKVDIIEIDGTLHIVVCHYPSGNISGTSHGSLDEAKTQAHRDFGIEGSDWIETPDEAVDKEAILMRLLTVQPIRVQNMMSTMTLQTEHCTMIVDKLFREIVEDPTPRGDFDIGTLINKTARLNFGSWKNPLSPIPNSHTKILQPILSEPNRKKAWYDLAETYMAQDEEFRLTVSKFWDFGVDWEWRLPISSAGIPVPILSRVRSHLIYYSVAVRYSRDIRDDLCGIAHTYHLCDANGYDANEVFRSVAKVSLPIIGRLLINFVERDPDLRSLKAFCLEKVEQPDGTFEIVRNW